MIEIGHCIIFLNTEEEKKMAVVRPVKGIRPQKEISR